MSTTTPPKGPKGPRFHRVFIWLASALLTLLFIWLLGFVASDISNLPGPDWTAFEEEYLDPDQVARSEARQREIIELDRQRQNLREDQDILQQSTRESQQTMNQMLELHRLKLQQELAPAPEAEEALAESQQHFLEQQQRFQEANQRIAELSSSRQELQEELEILQQALSEQRGVAREAYSVAYQAHSWRVAAWKLLLLVPLLLLTTYLIMRYRKSPYAPIAYAAFIAVFWWVALTMHQHFPQEYFKYIAIFAAILVVLYLLTRLIRMSTRPPRDWLLRRYREAYHSKSCPICAYPFQGVHGLKTLPDPHKPLPPYTCPACGTTLFNDCAACGQKRHTLLPHCCHCGAQTPSES